LAAGLEAAEKRSTDVIIIPILRGSAGLAQFDQPTYGSLTPFAARIQKQRGKPTAAGSWVGLHGPAPYGLHGHFMPASTVWQIGDEAAGSQG
jgi:hypothetical protein